MNNMKNNILNISHDYYHYLLNLKNVNAIGYGSKYINGHDTKEPCIHVLVENKIDVSYLTKNTIIPKTFMGIKTDVIKIGKLRNKNSDSSEPTLGMIRPIEGGYDVSADTKKLGTIGCIVTNIIDNKNEYYILSNNHILADGNNIPIGSPIYQPSIYYSSEFYKEQIGTLANFINIKYGNLKPFLKTNYMDCAIAHITNKNLISNKIAHIGAVKGVSTPEKDLSIKKVGAMSGLTEGKIETLGVTTISKNPRGKFALFKNQIRASIINKSGDSGSVVLNKKNEIIGLFFSGTDDDQTMMFTDINVVLKALKVKIYVG